MSAGTPDLAGAEVEPSSGVIPSVCGTSHSLAGTPVDRLAMEGTSAVFQGVRDLAVYEAGAGAAGRRGAGAAAARLPDRAGAGSLATTTVEPLEVGDRGGGPTRV